MKPKIILAITIKSNIAAKSLFISLLLMFSGIAFSDTQTSEKRGLEWQGPKKELKIPYVAGKYHALIIGNEEYTDKNGVWKDLSTAANDAKALAGLLKKDYGFHNVTLMRNAGRRDILQALDDLSVVLEPNDNVLIYYAGHGHLEEEKNRGFWIPTDAIGGEPDTYLRNSTIRDEINIIAERTKHTLVISDSCFSGTLMRSATRGSADDAKVDGYYAKVGNKKSVQVLAAGGEEFVDDSYRDSGHSPFTYFLINELKHNTKALLSLAELATNVSIAVANNVEQTPESGVLLGAGDELGQFIFARVNVSEGVVSDVTIGAGAVPKDIIEWQKPKPKPLKLEDYTIPTLRL